MPMTTPTAIPSRRRAHGQQPSNVNASHHTTEGVMAIKTVLLGVAVGSIVCGGYATEVIGRELPFKAKYSGSGMSAYPDPNHDGIRAGTGVLGCTSNLGRCAAQGVGEAVYTGSATCPNGNPGIGLELIPGTGHGFTRFDKGDMLFSELVTESVCYDPSLRMHFKSGTGKYTGGTGRFAGATGEYQFEGTQWVLYLDAEANGFAAQEGRITGTIVLPGN
jgi:hypothetical protein